MKEVGVTKFVKNKINPFIEETIQHVSISNKTILMGSKDDEFMVTAEGEFLGHSIFAHVKKVDKAQFAKIYLSNLSSLFDLSKTGIRVLSYIIKSVKPNSDWFLFEVIDCMEDTGYKSEKSVWKGMGELLQSKFIARSDRSYKYFINPTIFFNGDRISFIQSFQVVEDNSSMKDAKSIEK